MPSPVVHFEIGCRNAQNLKGFYAKMFGWDFEAYGPAVMTQAGMPTGIGGHLNQLGHEPHNYVLVYVQVDDLQASLDQAKTLGGQTLIPPQEVPGMGHFAWFKDPEGNVIGLWKPASA